MISVLCDIDGVIWRGDEIFPKVGSSIRRVIAAGVNVMFCTNNSFRTHAAIKHRLTEIVGSEDFRLVTSPEIVADLVRSRSLSPVPALVIGESGLFDALPSDLVIHTSNVGAQIELVVVGLDRNVSYETLAIAHDAIVRGATFLAANDDPSYPVEKASLPGAGALVAFLERSTGVNATICGKPHKASVDYLQRLIPFGDRVIVIGDRIDQDRGLANALNAEFRLVLTGSTSRSQAERAQIPFSEIFNNLGEALENVSI